jgi:hypothetical protein
MHHLRDYLANICTVIEVQFVCGTPLKDIHAPAMFVMAHTFVLHLLATLPMQMTHATTLIQPIPFMNTFYKLCYTHLIHKTNNHSLY